MSTRLEEVASIENGNRNSEEKSYWQKNDRELLMVMATFVAAVAFQAGVNPPGGVWQDDSDPRYEAGKSIMATKRPYEFCAFIAGVTVCLACSVMQLLVLLFELPHKKMSASRKFLQFMMDMAITSMALAYGCSVKALTPDPLMPRVILVLVVNVVISAVLLSIFLHVQKRAPR